MCVILTIEKEAQSGLWERGCGLNHRDGRSVVRLQEGVGVVKLSFILCLAGSRDWQWEDGGMCPVALVCFQASFHTSPILLPHPPPHTCTYKQAFCLPIIQIVYETLRDRKAGKTGRVTAETTGRAQPHG